MFRSITACNDVKGLSFSNETNRMPIYLLGACEAPSAGLSRWAGKELDGGGPAAGGSEGRMHVEMHNRVKYATTRPGRAKFHVASSALTTACPRPPPRPFISPPSIYSLHTPQNLYSTPIPHL